jgi:hypothetical protein
MLESEEDFDINDFMRQHDTYTKNSDVEGFLEHAPDKFVNAYRNGLEAEWEPFDGLDTDWWPSYDDDDEVWKDYDTYVFQYRTEGGKLYEVVMSCDKDGNWDFASEAEFGTPEQKQQAKDYGLDGWIAAMRSYYEWVVENGKDPLDYLRVGRQNTAEDKWLVGFVESNGRARFAQARHIGQNPPERPTTDFTGLPQEVKDYCVTDETLHVQDMTWDEVKAASEKDALENKACGVKTVGGREMAVFSVVIKSHEYQEGGHTEVIAAAQHALSTLGTPPDE